MLDPRGHEARDQGGLALDDPLVFLSQPDSVVLTRAFARRRGLAIGDAIGLMTPGGARRFTLPVYPAATNRPPGGV